MKARLINLFLAVIFTGQLVAQKWPDQIFPSRDSGNFSIERTNRGYLYETKSYRIEIPQKIDQALMTNFVMSAESVAFAVKSIPLPLFSPSDKEKPIIKVTLDEKSYYSSGGAKGTAGFYSGRAQKVIIQWEQLNRTLAESKLLRRPAFDLLVHELTHLCMHEMLWKMDQWLIEGVAEYLAAAHTGKGRFDFSKIDAHIRDHIRSQVAAEGQKVSATNIKLLLELSSRDWLARTAELSPKEALESYTSALLLTHFTFHGGEKRREEIRNYLEKLGKVALAKDPKPILFTTKEASTIEGKLKAYWKTRGIQLEFK